MSTASSCLSMADGWRDDRTTSFVQLTDRSATSASTRTLKGVRKLGIAEFLPIARYSGADAVEASAPVDRKVEAGGNGCGLIVGDQFSCESNSIAPTTRKRVNFAQLQ